MNLVTGDTIWSKINPIIKQYPSLECDAYCEAIILGGGVTGALCAYYFAKDTDCMLIEKNILGYGSTRGCTAILQYEIDKDLIGLSDKIGKFSAIECFKEMKNALYEVKSITESVEDDCGFALKDCLYYTNSKLRTLSLQKEFELRKETGFEVSYIENSDDFSFPIAGGIYSKALAGEIDPYKFTHSLIECAVKDGLKVHENTNAVNILGTEDGVIVTTDNGFKIHAKKAIIATGYKGADFIKRKTAIFTRSFNIVTKPLNVTQGWHNRAIIRDTANPYTYIRGTRDNRMIIGGLDEPIVFKNGRIAELDESDKLSKKKYNKLRKKLFEMFPYVEPKDIDFTFSGYFAETKDGLPYIGEHKDYKNMYFCLGYGSNGVLNSLIGAKMLLSMYKGETAVLMGFER